MFCFEAVQNDEVGSCKRGRPKFGSTLASPSNPAQAGLIQNCRIDNKSKINDLFENNTSNIGWHSIDEIYMNLQHAEERVAQLLPSALGRMEDNEVVFEVAYIFYRSIDRIVCVC